VCEELRRATDVFLPLDTSINSAEFNAVSAEDDFGAFHFLSRSMSKRALKGNVKAEHSRVRWPTEPEGLLLRIPTLIEEYFEMGERSSQFLITALNMTFLLP